VKPHISEVIIVEGRYDRNTVSQVVDAHIIETNGFGIFSDKEKVELIRQLAEKRGVIVFTDSDGAGFVIRNRIKGSLPADKVKHAYIPDVVGKEKRKKKPSKEGQLGVEGMSPEIILDALKRCGATFDGKSDTAEGELTKADLYSLRLSGFPDSAKRRKEISEKLGLPEKLSSNALLDVLNALYSKTEIMRIFE